MTASFDRHAGLRERRASLFAHLQDSDTQPRFWTHVAENVDWTVEGTILTSAPADQYPSLAPDFFYPSKQPLDELIREQPTLASGVDRRLAAYPRVRGVPLCTSRKPRPTRSPTLSVLRLLRCRGFVLEGASRSILERRRQ
jgi:hypothetical protein